MRYLLCLCLLACSTVVMAAATFTPVTAPVLNGKSLTEATQLCALSQQVRQYRKGGPNFDKRANHIGPLRQLGFEQGVVDKTLSRICEIHQQDKATGHTSRLMDPEFLAQNFEWIRWQPDMVAAAKLAKKKSLVAKLPNDKILMTKYYVRRIEGKTSASTQTPHALYSIPYEEQHLSFKQAEKKRGELIRYKYGKQAILSGFLTEQQLAPALTWVSRNDLEAALMQGTAVAEQNGQTRYFNVHRNNGIAYDRTVKPELQQRYWYFKEVNGIYGYGKDAGDKVMVEPQMTLAGDVRFFGLGQLFMLSYPLNGSNQRHFRLAIMGDTGGAFVNNQFQIDLLTGYYRNWDEYHRNNKHLADYVDAWILVAK